MYALIVAAAVTTDFWSIFIYTFAFMRASRVIHEKLVGSLLGSTFRWDFGWSLRREILIALQVVGRHSELPCHYPLYSGYRSR